MSEEHLIPIQTRPIEEQKQIQSKGGSRSTPQKKKAGLITQSHKAKCKNCGTVCTFKEHNLLRAINHICTVPEARANAIWNGHSIMSKEVLEKMSIDTLETMRMMIQDNPSLTTVKLLHDTVEAKKHRDFPVVQTSVSLSAEVSELSLEDDFANFKKLQIKWEQKNSN